MENFIDFKQKPYHLIPNKVDTLNPDLPNILNADNDVMNLLLISGLLLASLRLCP